MPSYVPIITIRGTSTVIDDTPVHDGQILFDESRKCLFMDNGNTRNKYSGLGADSNVATVEDTTTSTHAYAKGDYVVVEGQLYEVTAAIAVGDTFSVGTNVSVTTVGDELVQIKSDLSAIPTIETGSINIQALSVQELTQKDVVYTKSFTTAPKVFVTLVTGYGEQYVCAVSQLKTGCRVIVKNGASVNVGAQVLNWMAIGY